MLAVAAALGVGVPVERAVRPPEAERPDRVGPSDEALAAWRPLLARVGVRIPLVLPVSQRASAASSARLLLTSYTLAPAVVHPVVLSECSDDCGLRGVPHLLLCDAAVGQAMGLALRLGLTQVTSAGPCALLRRPAP